MIKRVRKLSPLTTRAQQNTVRSADKWQTGKYLFATNIEMLWNLLPWGKADIDFKRIRQIHKKGFVSGY